MRMITVCGVLAALAGAADAQTTWVLDCPMLTGTAYQDEYGRYSPGLVCVSPGGGYIGGYSVVSSVPMTFMPHRDAWIYHGGATTRIRGLAGSIYEPNGVNGSRYHTVARMNDLGHAVGSSQRRTNAVTLGEDAWFYNGSACVLIGPTGGAFSPADGSRYSNASRLNAADQVVGVARQYTANSGVYTDTAWFYENGVTTLLGLSGPAWTSAGGFRLAIVVAFNEQGRVIGTSDRFVGGPSRDLWVFQNGVTTQINPTSGEFLGADGRRESTATVTDNPQLVAGNASVYTPGTNTVLGNKAWVYANGITTVISPPNADAGGLTAVPQFARGDAVVVRHGWFNTPGISGAETWVHRHGVATRTGLVNPVGPRYSEARAMNDSGVVVGYSNRYTSGQVTGTQAWMFTPDTADGGTTISVHPLSARFVFAQQSSTPVALTPQGYVVLTAQVNSGGREVLVYRDGVHSVIDISGTPGYTASNGYHFSDVGNTSVNSHGQVLGTTARLNPDGSQLGATPWLWDPATGLTTVIPIPTSPSGQFQYSARLAEDGSISGKYALYTQGILDRYRSFIWSPELGFVDLENAVGAAAMAAKSVRYIGNPASSDVYPSINVDLSCGDAVAVNPGDFRIYVVHPLICGPADLGRQGGLPRGDGRLDNNDFIAFINLFFANEAEADLGGPGGLTGQDGQLNNNDFIAFISLFFNGCG
ncbi:MAG: GC-type dockerin domain-anchored protein [Phycisphaerales bacterium]